MVVGGSFGLQEIFLHGKIKEDKRGDRKSVGEGRRGPRNEFLSHMGSDI